MDFIGNVVLFPAVREFENQLTFDKVTTMSLVAPFLGQCVEFSPVCKLPVYQAVKAHHNTAQTGARH